MRDGTVLRISTNQASAWALMMDLLWPIILIAVLAIGLSIVKHAAAYHKAEITLESTPGKGTTITIQF